MPDRGPGTSTNYGKRKWNTTFPSEIPTGNFPLLLGIFHWDEPTKRVPFTAEPEIPEILNGKILNGKRLVSPEVARKPLMLTERTEKALD